jgi:hypothetical protein
MFSQRRFEYVLVLPDLTLTMLALAAPSPLVTVSPTTLINYDVPSDRAAN